MSLIDSLNAVGVVLPGSPEPGSRLCGLADEATERSEMFTVSRKSTAEEVVQAWLGAPLPTLHFDR